MKEYILGIPKGKQAQATGKAFIRQLVEVYPNMQDASSACGDWRVGITASTLSRAKVRFTNLCLNDFQPTKK